LKTAWNALEHKGIMVFKEAAIDKDYEDEVTQQHCRTHKTIKGLFKKYRPMVKRVFFSHVCGGKPYRESLVICQKH